MKCGTTEHTALPPGGARSDGGDRLLAMVGLGSLERVTSRVACNS